MYKNAVDITAIPDAKAPSITRIPVLSRSKKNSTSHDVIKMATQIGTLKKEIILLSR